MIGIEYDDKELLRNLERSYPEIHKALKNAQIEIAQGIADKAILIISTFVDASGHRQGVDTGAFINGIHLEELQDAIAVMDSVDYGIKHEYGTEAQRVPLFDKSGNLTAVGEWAMRKFEDLGWEAIGKKGNVLKRKTKLGKLAALRARGSIVVKLDEMAPFRTGQAYMEGRKEEIVRRNLDAIRY